MSDSKIVRMVAMSEEKTIVRDSADRVHFVDFITEVRDHNGVAYISLGSGIMDGAETPFCDITCRLRMSLVTAGSLHSALGQLLQIAQRAPKDTKAQQPDDPIQRGHTRRKFN